MSAWIFIGIGVGVVFGLALIASGFKKKKPTT